MEYGENDDTPDGVTKWPFYFSALFILALVLGFAYLHFQENKTHTAFRSCSAITSSATAPGSPIAMTYVAPVSFGFKRRRKRVKGVGALTSVAMVHAEDRCSQRT